ncbi:MULTISPECIES: TonB-dependent receptor [unclassified Apibacter]|uniref:TonB-dependent receptor n=1 Tax=unclassified Apibacter TaxID=2630820 RepID=UPI001C86F1FF|nr:MULTISPECIES: TonB-dependent receptor [unclassified Apibacter]
MMMNINHKYSVFAFLLSLMSPLSYSQEKKDSITVTELQEILATGKRNDKGIIPFQELKGKELENRNSSSVADAVRLFSGIQLKDYGGVGGMKTVNIRGMGSEHVGVFYDGIAIGNAQNGMVDLGKFSMDNLESISVYNGQKSQIFQPAKDFGSAGSIYLTTKRPVFTGEKKTNIGATYRSGSFHLINTSLLWEQKLSSLISSSLTMEYINSDGKYKFQQKKGNWDTIAVRQNGNISAFRTEGNLFGILPHGKWNLKGYYYDSSRGIPGAVLKNSYKRYQFAQQWDRNLFLQGSFEKIISTKYRIALNAKYAHDFTHYKNLEVFNDPIWGNKFSNRINNTYKQDELYITSSQLVTLFSFWDISLSADYQHNGMNADLKNFASPSRNTEMIALATAFHWDKLKIQTSVLGTFVQDKTKHMNSMGTASDKNEFTPAVFLNYQPLHSKDISIHGFYKRIFRMPTFNDLYYTDFGNSNLKPEYTNQFDAGIRINKNFTSGSFTHFDLTIDAYYNTVKDKIIAYPKGQQFRWTMLNFGKARIKGLDLSSKTSIVIKNVLVSTLITYTYEDAQNLSSPILNYKNQLPYIPWHSGTFTLEAAYRDWNLNYSFMYTGERYNSPSNNPDNHVKAWYTHDIQLSRELFFTNIKCKASLQINNIFNKYYDIVANYPMPGRNYTIIIKLNI